MNCIQATLIFTGDVYLLREISERITWLGDIVDDMEVCKSNGTEAPDNWLPAIFDSEFAPDLRQYDLEISADGMLEGKTAMWAYGVPAEDPNNAALFVNFYDVDKDTLTGFAANVAGKFGFNAYVGYTLTEGFEDEKRTYEHFESVPAEGEPVKNPGVFLQEMDG